MHPFPNKVILGLWKTSVIQAFWVTNRFLTCKGRCGRFPTKMAPVSVNNNWRVTWRQRSDHAADCSVSHPRWWETAALRRHCAIDRQKLRQLLLPRSALLLVGGAWSEAWVSTVAVLCKAKVKSTFSCSKNDGRQAEPTLPYLTPYFWKDPTSQHHVIPGFPRWRTVGAAVWFMCTSSSMHSCISRIQLKLVTLRITLRCNKMWTFTSSCYVILFLNC